MSPVWLIHLEGWSVILERKLGLGGGLLRKQEGHQHTPFQAWAQPCGHSLSQPPSVEPQTASCWRIETNESRGAESTVLVEEGSGQRHLGRIAGVGTVIRLPLLQCP